MVLYIDISGFIFPPIPKGKFPLTSESKLAIPPNELSSVGTISDFESNCSSTKRNKKNY
jgi:hypothetical protein